MQYYKDRRTGRTIFETHHYVCMHGAILGAGFPDPKTMYEPNETLVANLLHPDDRSYVCGPDCQRDQARSDAALEALREYWAGCSECQSP